MWYFYCISEKIKDCCPNLTVAENIFIGREPKKFGFIDWKQINKRSADLLNSLNIHIDVTKTLDHYSVAIQQMIAIARAVDVDAKILILDEPTSSLDKKKQNVCLALFVNYKKRDGNNFYFTFLRTNL